MKSSQKKLLKTLLKVTISIGLMIYVLNSLDLSLLSTRFSSINYAFYPLIFSLVILNYFVSSARWKYLLSIYDSARHVSLWQLVRLYFEGAFISNFLPTSIGGDVYKSYTLGKMINDQSKSFGATFTERFSGVVVLGVLALVGLITTFKAWGFMIFLAFVLGGLVFFAGFKTISDKYTKLKPFYDALLIYWQHKRVLTIAILASVIVQVASILTQHLIFSSLGVNLPLQFSFFAFPVIILASFVIPSQNSLGVQDFLYASLFQKVGFGAEIAVLASLLYHAVRAIVSLVGGVSYAVKK